MRQLQSLVRSEWNREVESGLATLRRVPSTGMRWFLGANHGEDIDWIPEREHGWIQAIVTAKSADLRKAIRPVMKQRGYVETSNKASDWRWTLHGENGFVVLFDFGGMDSQLRYDVRPSRARSTPLPHRSFGYEGILGLVGFCSPNGNWDTIERQSVDDAAALVVEFIERTVAVLERAEQLIAPVS